MDSFLNQGRCRVCGQMFCCRKHQLEHERVKHDEYADWLDMLPALCRRCHRTVKNIHDFNGKCIQFNMKHTLMNSTLLDSTAGTPKRSYRKRVLTVNVRDIDEQPSAELDSSDSNNDAALVELRKRITPSRRLKKQMSPVVFIDLHEIKNRDDIITAVFSPQFNISQNIFSGDAKSSTPLYEEKENLPVIAIFDKTDMSSYKTPDTIQNASLVVVSALKKSTSREGIIKDGNSKGKKPNSRKVTFEMAQTPDVENVSVYATPEAEMFCPDDRRRVIADQQEMTMISFDKVEKNEMNSQAVEISIYGTLESDTEFMVESLDTDRNKGRDCAAVAELVRNMKSAVTGIPRMIFNACGWSVRAVIRKRKNEDTSPICLKKAKQNRRMLKRRPISSHWINLPGTTMRRRPLTAYCDVDEESVWYHNHDAASI